MTYTTIRKFAIVLVTIVFSFKSTALFAANGTFTPIGRIGNDYSWVEGISGNGQVVIGNSVTSNGVDSHAFRWTSSTGITLLGDLPGGRDFSRTSGVSFDGSVIVGDSSTTASTARDFYYSEAFRWVQGTGMTALGPFTTSDNYSGAANVSADGSIIVGFANSSQGGRAFRWTSSGVQFLGTIGNSGATQGATTVSGDGSVVVGRSVTSQGEQAFRWTAATGTVGIGYLPHGPIGLHDQLISQPWAISANGNVIVGSSTSTNGPQAFKWTASGGMVGLGDLPGGIFSSDAYDVSADGARIVGASYGSTDSLEAVLWDNGGSPQKIKDLLIANGVSSSLLSGWRLENANAISDDGRTIAGNGYGPTGEAQGWVAILPAPVPEPSSIALAIAGVIGAMSVAWKKKFVARVV